MLWSPTALHQHAKPVDCLICTLACATRHYHACARQSLLVARGCPCVSRRACALSRSSTWSALKICACAHYRISIHACAASGYPRTLWYLAPSYIIALRMTGISLRRCLVSLSSVRVQLLGGHWPADGGHDDVQLAADPRDPRQGQTEGPARGRQGRRGRVWHARVKPRVRREMRGQRTLRFGGLHR